MASVDVILIGEAPIAPLILLLAQLTVDHTELAYLENVHVTTIMSALSAIPLVSVVAAQLNAMDEAPVESVAVLVCIPSLGHYARRSTQAIWTHTVAMA